MRRAVSLLETGAVIAIPTDTVMGLVCAFDNEFAIQRVFTIKGRPETNPLPVLIASVDQLPLLVESVPDTARVLMERFWPGPLTIVLHAKPSVSRLITAGAGKVGIRIPAHPAALRILATFGKPVASTSANRSGQPPAITPMEVSRTLSNVNLVVGDSTPLSGVASTVVDVTQQPPVVTRQGSVSRDEIASTLSGSRPT